MDRSRIVKQQKLLRSRRFQHAHKLLKAIAGNSRFGIILVLHEHQSGLTVTQLAEIFDSSLSKISHQLAVLRRHGVVKAKSERRQVRYTLSPKSMKVLDPLCKIMLSERQ